MDMGFERPSNKYAVPARQTTPLAPAPSAVPKKNSFSKHKTNIIITIIASLAVLTAGSSLLWQHIASSRSPIPAKIIKSVDFPIYYPKPMPDGFKIDPYSFEPSSNLLLYRLVNPSQNIAITASMQPRPAKFDTSGLSDNQTPPISLPIGTAYTVATGGQTRYVVLTEKTLIFLTPNGPVDDAVIKPVLFSLQAAR